MKATAPLTIVVTVSFSVQTRKEDCRRGRATNGVQPGPGSWRICSGSPVIGDVNIDSRFSVGASGR
jgi:hypothetical protein